MNSKSAIAWGVLALLHAAFGAEPVAAQIFVSNRFSHSISVIDPATHTVIDTIPQVGPYPGGIASVPSRGTMYVSDFGGENAPEYHLSLVSAVSRSVIAQITIPGIEPSYITTNNSGSAVYVGTDDHHLHAVDTTTNTVSWTIPTLVLGQSALLPDGSRLYVPTQGGAGYGVAVIDTSTHTVLETIPLTDVPFLATVNPAGTEVWVDTGPNANPMHVIVVVNAATNRIVATIPVAKHPSDIVFDPAGAFAYVPIGNSPCSPAVCAQGVYIIDTATHSVVGTITLSSIGEYSGGSAIDPTGTYLYITDTYYNLVYVVDLATRTLATTVPVGAAPQHIGIYVPTTTCPPGVVQTHPNSIYLIDATAGIVTDQSSGLMWKQCSEGQSGASCSGSAITKTWAQALTTAAGSTFAGHNDWRLPNIKELQSLFEPSCLSPKINRSVFPATSQVAYWSSSTFAETSDEAWIVNFGNSLNLDYFDAKTGANALRLVRGGRSMGAFDGSADTTPDAFAFTPQTGVPTSVSITSNTVTLSGFATVASISIGGASNAQYSINGGTFTASIGSVVSGNTVAIRQTSAATPNVTTTATLAVNGVHADFAVTTGVVDPVFSNGFD